MTRRTVLAALAALALLAPDTTQAGDEPAEFDTVELGETDFFKGGEMMPPIERRLPAAAGRTEFADVRESLVLRVRLVDIGRDGNDHGGFVTYEFTPADDGIPPIVDATTGRRKNPNSGAKEAARDRVRFLQEYRGDCIPPGAAEGESGEGGYVQVLAVIIAGRPGCLMVEADSRALVQLGCNRLRAANVDSLRAALEAIKVDRAIRAGQAARRAAEPQGVGEDAGREAGGASPEPVATGWGITVNILTRLSATGVVLLVGGCVLWALLGRRARKRPAP